MRLRKNLLDCASTIKYWRKTIKTKAQGLIQDVEDIKQQNEDRRRLLSSVEQIKQDVLDFNKKVNEYNRNSKSSIVETNGMNCLASLAEIENLIIEKQKVNNKLEVANRLKNKLKGKQN